MQYKKTYSVKKKEGGKSPIINDQEIQLSREASKEVGRRAKCPHAEAFLEKY